MTKGWSIPAGLITIYLISSKLTFLQQGFYYTFASLLALQILFELGFSNVISQFASHEMAHLRWKSGLLEGNSYAKERIYSLFHLAVKWYGVASILMVIFITPAGYFFFLSEKNQPEINWQYPWTFLVLFTSGNLFISPLNSLLEGMGKVSQIAKMRLIQSMLSSTAAWIFLLLGSGLYISSITAAITFAINLTWFITNQKKLLHEILNNRKNKLTNSIKWKDEIWPIQWRIALSWLSGYFIFQLFTPIAFRFHGAGSAGQLGMSLSIASVAGSVATAWISTKTPFFGQLIAQKEYNKLDEIYKRAFWQSCAILIITLSSLLLLVSFFKWNSLHIADRILPPYEFGLVLATTLANHIIYAQATYVRAHKRELYLPHAILLSATVGTAAYTLGRFSTISNMLMAYALIYGLIGVLYSNKIFHDFKKSRSTNTER